MGSSAVGEPDTEKQLGSPTTEKRLGSPTPRFFFLSDRDPQPFNIVLALYFVVYLGRGIIHQAARSLSCKICSHICVECHHHHHHHLQQQHSWLHRRSYAGNQWPPVSTPRTSRGEPRHRETFGPQMHNPYRVVCLV